MGPIIDGCALKKKNRRNDDRLISTAARPSRTLWPSQPTKQSRTSKDKHKKMELWWAEAVLVRLIVQEVDQCTTFFETVLRVGFIRAPMATWSIWNFSWNWFQQKHPSPLPQHISNRIRNVSTNGIIEAHRHRNLELIRCWMEKIIAIAGNPNAQEIIGWNAECLILMSIALCYSHFIGKTVVIWWFTLKSWISEVINSTGESDSEEYE